MERSDQSRNSGIAVSRRDRLRVVKSESGFALILTLLVLVLFATLVAAAMSGSMSSLRTSTADYHGSRTFYAAEAAAEAALSDIEKALDDGVIEDAEIAAITPPAIAGFDFSEFQIVRDGNIYVDPITDGPFVGLYSLTQQFVVYAKASDESGSHSAIELGGKAQAIPVFQFGWFLGGGGQFGAGGRWDAFGRAHANGDLYLIGCDSHFHEPITTPGKVHRDGLTKHRPLGGGVNMCPINVYIDDASAVETWLSFDSDDTPDPDLFKSKSVADYDGRLMTDAFGVDSLKLPLPVGVPPRELIRPREASDTDTEKKIKFAWKADMYVTVDLADQRNKNAECGGSPPAGSPSKLPHITIVRDNGFSAVPDDARKCRMFRFRWESFFDNHEEGWIDVLDVDLWQLVDWIRFDVGDGTEILYVDFVNVGTPIQNQGTTDGNGPIGTPPVDNFDDEYFPVMRIINGAELHGPFTLGSERVVYVQGDYNTVNWQPSAVFSDLPGVLSNAWDDNNPVNQGNHDYRFVWCRFTSTCPKASNTTQYVAYVTGTGIGNLDCYHEDPTCPPPVINPNDPNGNPLKMIGGKMLENWRNSTNCSAGPSNRCLHTWRGSSVALYAPVNTSIYYNFPGDNYYYPPNRDHAFDTRFQDPDSLPPGTPLVGQVLRAAFRESY